MSAVEHVAVPQADAGDGRRPFSADLARCLQRRFGTRYATGTSVLQLHARGESPFPPIAPDAVVFAESEQDVVDLVNLCRASRCPVIAFGAGSSLEGQLLAVQGGVSLDLGRMNDAIRVNAEDLTATVSAGVTREQLNQAVRASGLFFPIDPGAHASLGGMAATRASGTNAVKYGSMRENVLGLRVVTSEGKVIATGSRAKKSAAGYDLTRLFVGSEGTLGIITEVTVRLYPLPECVSAAVMSFDTADGAVGTVIDAIQSGIPIARSEYLCPRSIHAINAVAGMALRERPTLFVEFHGTPASMDEQIERFRALAEDHGGTDFDWAARPEDRTRLWTARHNAYFSCKSMRAGAQVVVTDTCVPLSRLAASLAGAEAILQGASFPTMLFGHVGDGNFHALMIVDPDAPHEHIEAEALNERIVKLALGMEGTCSGEHGIGLHKMGFLPQEVGEDAIDVMRAIKQAMDPFGILNPGKIFRPHPLMTA